MDLLSIISNTWGSGDWGQIAYVLGQVEQQELGFEGKEKASRSWEEVKMTQVLEEGLKS